MIDCKSCRTGNSVDSKFCKYCGAVLAEQAAQVAVKPEEIDSLLKEGFGLVHEQNLPHALFVAETILGSHPENSGALALKAMVYEEQGEFEAAISCYEKVVETNPDSTLDRIKLAQLNRKLETRETPEDLDVKSRKWVAVLSGVGAALAVVIVGVILAINKGSAHAQSGQTLYAANEAELPRGFDIRIQQMQDGQTQYDQGNTTPAVQQQPQQQQRQGTLPPVVGNPMSGTRSVPPIGSTFIITPEGSQGRLPAVGSNSPLLGGSSAEIRPVEPAPPPPRDDRNIIEPRREERNPGRIQITPSNTSPANPSDPEVSENTYRIAQQKMAAGDFQGAIRDFQVSLAGSRRPAITHQLIGRCYARIGEIGSARRHFETALELYEKAGSANEARAVRRELELLSG